LTLPMEQFRVLGADTQVTPYDSSTGSSRSTTLMGTAVQKAARDLKQQFIKIGAQTMGVKPGQVQVVDGALICGESRLTFKEAFERRFGKGAGGEMIGRGEAGPEITDNKLPVFWEVGMGTAEVEIDHETGEVSLKKFTSVADVGKAIHPEHCVAQEEGAAMQGIGHTFFEELIYDGGQLINPNLIVFQHSTMCRRIFIPSWWKTATAPGRSACAAWPKAAFFPSRRRCVTPSIAPPACASKTCRSRPSACGGH
jgi:CO/xanthine dehydrogenase Mo-binding subunit